MILTSTQAQLALTTDNNLKAFQRDITTQKLNWPKGVEWWKTNEFGSYHPKRKDDAPPLSVPDLAYIEFSRVPRGPARSRAEPSHHNAPDGLFERHSLDRAAPRAGRHVQQHAAR